MILYRTTAGQTSEHVGVEQVFNDAVLVCEAVDVDTSAMSSLLESLHWAAMQVRRAYPESEPRPIVLTEEQRAAIRETLQAAHDTLVAGLDEQGAPRGAIGQALETSNSFESTNGTLREKGHGRELWRLREQLTATLRLLGDGGDLSLLE